MCNNQKKHYEWNKEINRESLHIFNEVMQKQQPQEKTMKKKKRKKKKKRVRLYCITAQEIAYKSKWEKNKIKDFSFFSNSWEIWLFLLLKII